MNIVNPVDALVEALQGYQQLLSRSPIRESVLQIYLESQPILLDPSARIVRPTVELGAEYITDFVIETYDGRYILVEIEKTTDRLYLQNGDPSSALTHAEQQVLDWQGWVRRNIAYLRYEHNLMMNHPEGLVIIGRRSQMNVDEIQRLDERNLSRRGHLQVITFDHISTQFGQLIHNIERANQQTVR